MSVPKPKPPSPGLKTVYTCFFPPKPTFTENDIPEDLSGKIYLVTGASSGMGKELVSVLYARNATVYCACRSEEKARKVIDEIVNSTCPSTNTTQVPTRTATTAGELGADMRNSGGGNKKGAMHFLPLDLSDLSSVKFCAEKFLSREKKLHVLFNNAGVMTGPTPAGQPIPTTAQGHELALGFNCVGTFLLTRLLTPVLVSTANSEQMQSPGSVRVIWVSSFGLLQYAPFERGIDMDNLDYQREEREGIDRYGISKCGVWLLGVEFGRRYGSGLEGAGAGAGVTSVTINPGNLLTELARDAAWWISLWGGPFVISMPIPLLVAIHDFVYPFPHAPLNKDVMSLLYSSSKRILEWKRRYDTSANGNRPIFGVYTQLFAAFSPDLASNKVDWTREWVLPWGRVYPVRADLTKAVLLEQEGGNGNSRQFWEWCEQQVKDYL